MASPPTLILRDFEGETATAVELRVVRSWASVPGEFTHAGHYAGGGGDTPRRGAGSGAGSLRHGASSGDGSPRRSAGGGGATPRLDDIDSFSLPGAHAGLLGPLPSSMGHMDDIDEEPLGPFPGASAGLDHSGPISGPPSGSGVMDLWSRILARKAQAQVAPPTSSPVELWNRILSRRMAAQFPEEGLDADQWYDTLVTPPTPLVPAADDVALLGGSTLLDPSPLDEPASAVSGAMSAILFSGEEHEADARKRRARTKRASDSAFKARRSERLAAKEPPLFTDMLTRAKNAKATRLNYAKGSPRLRAAVADIDLDDAAVVPLPLRKLKELAVPCGVDPADLDAAVAAPVLSRAP